MIDPERIWSSDSLPTLPAVAVRLLEIARDPETETADVVEVIRTDPAISAKILRATNSSFFGVRSQVTSIERAVPLLGTNVVSSLALSFSLVDQSMSTGRIAELFADYWRESVVQACAAEIIGERVDDGLPCECFLTGLLLDIGRLAMLKTIPNEYSAVDSAARSNQRARFDVERETLGIDHVEVGVRLAENWELPAVLVEAIRLRDDRPDAPEDRLGSAGGLARTAAVASAAGDYFCSPVPGLALQQLEGLTRRYFGMDESRTQEYVERVRERIEHAAEMFSVDVTTIGEPSDLLARANEHLTRLAMQAHVASVQAEQRRDHVENEKRELEQQNRELKKRSVRDPLTELYNRRFFEEALDNEIERCRRSASPVAVLFSDIDHFKKLNDTYGHQFGDEVLVEVACTARDVMRKSDVVARYGGEEFVMLVLNPTEKALGTVAERLRTRIEALEFEHEGQPVQCTVSVGAAMAIPGNVEDDLGERLVEEADAAMYEAKRGGRNQVRVHCLLDDFERQLSRLATRARFSRWLVGQRVTDVATAARLLATFKPAKHQSFGPLSIEHGYLGEPDVDRVVEEQRSRAELRFGRIAHDLGLLSIEQVAWLIAQQQEPVDELARLFVAKGLVEPDAAADLCERFRATAPERTTTGVG